MEACWAHNPEVRRSKLRSARIFSSNCFFQTSRISVQVYLYKVTFAASYHHDPLAQRIARWTSNPKVLGSIPRWVDYIFRRWYFSKQGI